MQACNQIRCTLDLTFSEMIDWTLSQNKPTQPFPQIWHASDLTFSEMIDQTLSQNKPKLPNPMHIGLHFALIWHELRSNIVLFYVMHWQECAHNLLFPLAVFTPFTLQHVLDLRWFICASTCPYHIFNLPCSISSFTTITTNMNTSHTSNPTTDVLASDLMGPILSMTLAGSQHVPTSHGLWSPAERALAMPVKPCRLTHPESIE